MLALAYRMLGDVGRAQDMVQEAWLRWHHRDVEVDSPKAFLVTVVTRLCLNELTSARARREESRSDRLPEPVDLEARPHAGSCSSARVRRSRPGGG
jgi:RNA polymerase sigma-70 factor (ECF subfamily)